MPRMMKELSQGQSFSRTSDETGVSDTVTRTFRVVLLSPSETFDPQSYCGVFIGDLHPFNRNTVCTSYDAKFDGESRLATIVTFNYRSFASTSSSSGTRPEPKTIAPAIRPANWSTDTSLMEVPASTANLLGSGKWEVPVNPAGDRYEGITKMVPITTIRVEQLEREDPLRHMDLVGYINSETMHIGNHDFARHTVMLRGISSRAHVETFRGDIFRGWVASYEFAYRANEVTLSDPEGGNNEQKFVVGWDRLQVVEGYNIINKAAAINEPTVELFGLSLQHRGYKVFGPPYVLAEGTEGRKVRAMVGIPSYDDAGGWVQRPASAPVALNRDGTPRKIHSGNLRPYVDQYQVQPSADLVARMNLRLE